MAFPLLKKLTDVGDPLAKGVFKEEIARRLETRYPSVVNYLIEENYIDYLSREELLYSILGTEKAESILSIENLIKKRINILFEITEGMDPPYIIIKNQEIVELSLERCNLNRIPKKINKLDKLKMLNLASNNIQYLPKDMILSKNIEILHLGDNKLSKIPDWFEHLQSLSELSLNRNNLEVFPKHILQIEKIKYLYLSDNKIANIPKAINRLINLTVLDLSRNIIRDLPLSLYELKNLDYINLQGNLIKDTSNILNKIKRL